MTIGILNGRDGCRTASGHMVREREIHALCSNGGRVAGRGLSVHYSKGRSHTTGNPDNHPHTRSARASYGHGAASYCFAGPDRSEEHTSELPSLMRISYAVFCLKKKTQT